MSNETQPNNGATASEGAAGAAGANGDQHGAAGRESPVAPLAADLAALVELATHWLQTRLDLAKHRARMAALWAVVAVGAGVVGLAVVATAAVLLCLGAAERLGEALGAHWAGQLAVGSGVLGGLALAATVGLWIVRRKELISLRRKYERRRAEQRQPPDGDRHRPAHTAGPADRAGTDRA